jgi:hypothetical protein
MTNPEKVKENLSENKHSPTPWHDSLDINSTILYDSKNRKVVLTEENIRFIVKAVNNHEKLVEGLTFFFKSLGDQTLVRSVIDDGDSDWTLTMLRFVKSLKEAQQALADAGEK